MNLQRVQSPTHLTLAPPYHQPRGSLLPFIDVGEYNIPIDLDSFHSRAGDSDQPRFSQLQTSSTNLDETYSEAFSTYDRTATLDQIVPLDVPPETPALERGSVYLRFCQPSFGFKLLDYTYRPANLSLSAQLNGMFFLTPSPASSVDVMMSSPAAVACYRRNLFSVSGSVMLPRSLRYAVTERGDQVPIAAIDLGISAVESLEGNSVKLISVPFKSTLTPGSEDKGDREPCLAPLDMMSGVDLDPEFANFSIDWKRLQFRTSTANNGRRKELQQHFILSINVWATLKTGQRISICEASSGPIIVRGRSPRNFQSKKVHSGSSSSCKPVLGRSETGDSFKQNSPFTGSKAAYASEYPSAQAANYWTWSVSPSYQNSAAAYPGNNYCVGPEGYHFRSSPDRLQYEPQTSPSPPPALSFMDDEGGQPQYSQSGPTKKPRRISYSDQRASGFSLGPRYTGENTVSTDILYGSFPRSLDDWQEPVDTVYRPHIVHHITMPTNARANAMKSTSKRFFSEERAG